MCIRAAAAAAILLLAAGDALAQPHGFGVYEGRRGGWFGGAYDGRGEGIFDRILARQLYLDIRGARTEHKLCNKAGFDRELGRLDMLVRDADRSLDKATARASDDARGRLGSDGAAAQEVDRERHDLKTPLGQAANDSHWIHTSLTNLQGTAFDWRKCRRVAR